MLQTLAQLWGRARRLRIGLFREPAGGLLPFLPGGRLTTIRRMGIRTVRLAKPLYEAVPYAYMLAGLLTVWGAYHMARTFWADLALVLGVFCVVGGVVVLLKRRD